MMAVRNRGVTTAPLGEFGLRVLKLLSGTVIAQAVPIAISPILTRLYSPSDFGVLALFIAVTALLASVANARYELAIVLPAADDEALSIAALGLLISSVFAVFLTVVTVVFHGNLGALMGNPALGSWLFLAGPTVWLMGLFNVLNYYNTRLNQFGKIAQATVIKAVVLATIQLGIGLVQQGPGGLVTGQVASAGSANLRLGRGHFSAARLRAALAHHPLRVVARRYSRFPLFSMPGVFAQRASQDVTQVLMGVFYSVATLGHYSLAVRMLSTPSSTVGSAMGQVYYQAAAEELRSTGSTARAFESTMRRLLWLSIPAFTVLFVVAPDAFTLVFGDEWRTAGEYARLMTPFLALQFIAAPLSVTLTVHERQGITLTLNVVLLILVLSTVLAANLVGATFEQFLIAYSVVGSAWYSSLLLVARRLSKGTHS